MANLIRLKQIESSSYLEAAGTVGQDFSASVVNTVIQNVGVIMDGQTLNNITIGTNDADSYSLIISGAVAVVDANNLPTGSIGDDTNVPAQIWLNTNSILPADPSVSGSPVSNVIDNGEW